MNKINISNRELGLIVDEIRVAVRDGIDSAVSEIFNSYDISQAVSEEITEHLDGILDVDNVLEVLWAGNIEINADNQNEDNTTSDQGSIVLTPIQGNQGQSVNNDNVVRLEVVQPSNNQGTMNQQAPLNTLTSMSSPADFDYEDGWDDEYDDNDEDEEDDEDEDDDSEDVVRITSNEQVSPSVVRLTPIETTDSQTNIRRTDVQNTEENIPSISVTGNCPVCGEYNVGSTSCSNCGVVFGRVLRRHLN